MQELLPIAAVHASTGHVVELSEDGGEGIVVLVTADTIERRLPTIEWTRGMHGPAPAGRLWRRLETEGLAEDELARALAAAQAARAREFAECRHCGRRTPVEQRAGGACHGCASEFDGVAFQIRRAAPLRPLTR